MPFKKLRNLFIAAVALVAAAMPVSAQMTAADALKTIPDKLMPLLDKNTRLDMIDYYNSGSSTPSKNAMAGKSRILSLTPDHAVIELTSASSCEIAILPAGNDTLIALVNTVATPAPDSKLKIYTSDWSNDVTDKVFVAPTIDDWLTDEGKKNIDEVETMVPFMLAGGTFSNDGGTQYLLTNKIAQFLTEEVYKPMSSYFKPSITYKWNGKKLSK